MNIKNKVLNSQYKITAQMRGINQINLINIITIIILRFPLELQSNLCLTFYNNKCKRLSFIKN